MTKKMKVERFTISGVEVSRITDVGVDELWFWQNPNIGWVDTGKTSLKALRKRNFKVPDDFIDSLRERL